METNNKEMKDTEKKENEMDEKNYNESDDVLDFSEKNELDDMNDYYYDEDDDYDDDDEWDFTPHKETSSGAWTSLILGIIATLGWMIPIIGMPITIVGIVLGAMNLKSKKAKGAAISGFVINIVFLMAAIAKGIIDIIKICKRNK